MKNPVEMLHFLQDAIAEGTNNAKCLFICHGKEVGLMFYVQKAFESITPGLDTDGQLNCYRAMYLGTFIDTAERLCKA